MRIAIYLFILLTTACTSCSNAPPVAGTNPNQERVYQIKTGYNVALQGAIAYARLPRCPGATLCSDQAVLDRILAADAQADMALDQAERIVRDPNVTTDKAAAAITAANAAVALLTSITSQLVKP